MRRGRIIGGEVILPEFPSREMEAHRARPIHPRHRQFPSGQPSIFSVRQPCSLAARDARPASRRTAGLRSRPSPSYSCAGIDASIPSGHKKKPAATDEPLMLKTGFEPVRIAPRDFKSPASAVSPLQLIIPYAPRNPATFSRGASTVSAPSYGHALHVAPAALFDAASPPLTEMPV